MKVLPCSKQLSPDCLKEVSRNDNQDTATCYYCKIQMRRNANKKHSEKIALEKKAA
jgi:hypothetical protein